MKKILSLTLATLMLVSMIPTAMAAENNWEGGTKVEYTAADQTAYTITVPAQLAPGATGEVKLEGTWASDATVKVTADAEVVLTNSINAEDKHTLDITFAGIEKAGDNTQSRTYTENVTVAEMPANALFGTWSGKFNYNVEFAEIPADGEVYTEGDYKYTYKTSRGGWSVEINPKATDYDQTSYGAILESINGAPVTAMISTFSGCSSMTTAPVIPASVTNLSMAFLNCTGLTTAPEIPAGVTNMLNTFAGCTNLNGEISVPCAATVASFNNCPATVTYYHVDGCDGSCGK